MSVADMGEFHYQSIVDPSLLTKPDDSAVLGSSFDEIYPFGLPEGDFADALQADATFDFDDFDFDKQATQGVDSGFTIPDTPQSSFQDQRYVSLPSQPHTHPSSVWRPLHQPAQQFLYPDPNYFSHQPVVPTPYYPLQPLTQANTITPHNFQAITPPGQQFSSINRPLFPHGNVGPSPAAAALYQYGAIQPYQDNGTFNPEDLALSDIPEDLITTAICDGWALPGDKMRQKRSRPEDLYVPDTSNHDSDADVSDAPDSDASYHPSASSRTKRARRAKPSRPQALLSNGEVKKGRPCAKPQTEERRRVNQRRMEGYYRRKYDQGNLEKARQQSKESYWRRKQRRIEAGEKVRSYNASNKKKGRSDKRV